MFVINSAALGIESFTFGGILSDTMNCVMEKKVVNYPTIRDKTVELPNRPGVIDISSRYPLAIFGTREIEITIGLLAEKRMDEDVIKRLFYNKMQLIGTAILTFSGSPDRCVYAAMKEIAWDRVSETAGATAIRGVIKFTCSDPFAYDSTGPITVDIAAEVDNSGDIVAEAIYNITMGENAADLILTMGTSALKLEYGFVLGDAMQISTNGQVVLNESVFLIPTMSASKNFLEIPIGANTLVSNRLITGNIQYRRRYLGI